MICEHCYRSRGHATGCPWSIDDQFITCDTHSRVRFDENGRCAACMAKPLWNRREDPILSDELAEDFEAWVNGEIDGDFQNNVNMVALMEGMPGWVLREYWNRSCPSIARVLLVIQVAENGEFLGVVEVEGGDSMTRQSPYEVVTVPDTARDETH